MVKLGQRCDTCYDALGFPFLVNSAHVSLIPLDGYDDSLVPYYMTAGVRSLVGLL